MLFKQKEKEKKYINPRFRAYGKARLDIAKRAKTRQDWDELWKGSTNPYPFKLGESWKHCVEYKVDDFAAEVGFFVDILGLPVNAFDPSYAMFTSPDGDFFIGVVPTPDKGTSTPKDAIRLQFMVKNIMETTKELERRGVRFEQQPEPCQPDSTLHIGYFCTPHGIPVDLWGYVGEGKDQYQSDSGYDDVEDQNIIEVVSDELEDQAEGDNVFDDLEDHVEGDNVIDDLEDHNEGDNVIDDLEDHTEGDIVFEDEEDQFQDETVLDGIEEEELVDLDLEEEELEDLQLEIPLVAESKEEFEEPQKEEQDKIEGNISREQSDDAVEESLEENDEIDDGTSDDEESSYEYIYEEVPLRDWQIN